MRSIIVNSFREHVPNCVPERTFYVLRTDATKTLCPRAEAIRSSHPCVRPMMQLFPVPKAWLENHGLDDEAVRPGALQFWVYSIEYRGIVRATKGLFYGLRACQALGPEGILDITGLHISKHACFEVVWLVSPCICA